MSDKNDIKFLDALIEESINIIAKAKKLAGAMDELFTRTEHQPGVALYVYNGKLQYSAEEFYELLGESGSKREGDGNGPAPSLRVVR